MKQFLCRACLLALAFLMMFGLCSCALFAGKGETETTPFVISGEGENACRVIYPSGGREEQALMNIAWEFARMIRRTTGESLEVAPDSAEKVGKEILLGKTNRPLSATVAAAQATETQTFSFRVSGDQLAIVASDDTVLRLAVHYFEWQSGKALGATLTEGGLICLAGDLNFRHRVLAGKEEPADLISSLGAPTFRQAKAFSVLNDETYDTLTACTTVGDLLFAALSDGNGSVKIAMVDSDSGKLLQRSEPLALGGAVSMCYNPALDLLAVAHGGDAASTVSYVSPADLTLQGSVTVSGAVEGLAYDARNFRYITKLAGDEQILFWDNGWNALSDLTLEEVDLHSIMPSDAVFTDLIADSEYIYLLYRVEKSAGKARNLLIMLSQNGVYRLLQDLPCSETGLTFANIGRTLYLATKSGSVAGQFYRILMSPADPAAEPYTLFNPQNTATVDTDYIRTSKRFTVYSFSRTDYKRNTVLQGACTDGTYGYFFMEYQGGSGNYSNSETHDSVVVKVDMATNKLEAMSEPLKLGHSNDACYNPHTGQLVVCYNGNRKNLIYFIDPDTLTVVGEKTLSVNIFSIAYNDLTGQYVVGLSGGRDFAILDAEFNVVTPRLKTDGPAEIYEYKLGTDLLTQGIDCDSRYVYFVLSGRVYDENGKAVSWKNYLLAFDYNGKHQFTKVLPGVTNEIENVFHIGSTIYVSCNGSNAPCYQVTVLESEA